MGSHSIFRRSVVPRIAIAALGALALLPAAAHAARGDAAQPIAIDPGFVYTENTATAVAEAGEPYTGTAANCDGANVQMGKTVWFRVRGTGRAMLLSTDESSFDTVMAVYDTDEAPANLADLSGFLIDCNDDIDPDPLPVDRQSELVFNTVRGLDYLIQVGGYGSGAGAESGTLEMFAYSPPANDDRGDAQELTPGAPISGDNISAWQEDGEDLDCDGAPFTRTVWYRYNAPAHGRATFSVSGTFDTVLQVHRGSNAVACSDDARETGGASSVAMDVSPGEYLVQVGGYGNSFNEFGTMNTQVVFEEDLDVDNDGSNKGADCDDGNAGIRPGANDVPNNGVDEDCAGGDAIDRDNDGALAANDCDDGNPAVNPGAVELPGNSVDDDCKNGDERARLLAVPLSHLWQPSNRGPTEVLKLIVNVPTGAVLNVQCRGGGCPKTGRRGANFNGRSVARIARKFNLARGIFRNRKLAVGATVTLRVTRPGSVGRFWRFRMRKAKGPTVTRRCIVANGTALRNCPKS